MRLLSNQSTDRARDATTTWTNGTSPRRSRCLRVPAEVRMRIINGMKVPKGRFPKSPHKKAKRRYPLRAAGEYKKALERRYGSQGQLHLSAGSTRPPARS